MMMTRIAFCDFERSSLVSLVRGLFVASSSRLCVHIFCYVFLEGKICWKKKQVVPPPSIQIRVYFVHIYTNTYVPRFSPSGFFGPFRCLKQTPVFHRWHYMHVCTYTHTYTHIHSHPRQIIDKTQTTVQTHHQHLQIHPRMCIYATVQQLRCHGNYCELSWILCKHCAGSWLPHSHVLPRSRRTQPDDCSLKETI